MQVQLTPDLEQPDYQLLRVMKDYEIRYYEPFIVAETALPVGESEYHLPSSATVPAVLSTTRPTHVMYDHH